MHFHRLPNGREVFLIRMKIVSTYAGAIEGSTQTASQYLRKHLMERATEMLPPGYPLVLIEPSKRELPPWMCVAELESKRGVHNIDPDFNSRLYVCWFMADTTRSLDEIIASILPQVDWEKVAEDYDITNF